MPENAKQSVSVKNVLQNALTSLCNNPLYFLSVIPAILITIFYGPFYTTIYDYGIITSGCYKVGDLWSTGLSKNVGAPPSGLLRNAYTVISGFLRGITLPYLYSCKEDFFSLFSNITNVSYVVGMSIAIFMCILIVLPRIIKFISRGEKQTLTLKGFTALVSVIGIIGCFFIIYLLYDLVTSFIWIISSPNHVIP